MGGGAGVVESKISNNECGMGQLLRRLVEQTPSYHPFLKYNQGAKDEIISASIPG